MRFKNASILEKQNKVPSSADVTTVGLTTEWDVQVAKQVMYLVTNAQIDEYRRLQTKIDSLVAYMPKRASETLLFIF